MSPEIFIFGGAGGTLLGIIFIGALGKNNAAFKGLGVVLLLAGVGAAGFGFSQVQPPTAGSGGTVATTQADPTDAPPTATQEQSERPQELTEEEREALSAELGREFYKAIAALKDLDTANDKEAVENIFSAGPKSIPELLDILEKEQSPSAKEQITAILTRFEEDAIPRIVVAMKSPNTKRSRQYLPIALGNMGSVSVPALSEFVDDDDPAIQKLGIEGLALTADERANALLLEKIQSADDVNVQVAASRGLRKLEKESSVQPLLNTLEASDKTEVKKSLIETLGHLSKFDKKAVLPKVREFLDDEDWQLRAGAVNALGYAKDERSKNRIKKALGDDNKNVRAAAAFALGQLGAKDTMFDIQAQMEKETDNFTKRVMQKAINDLR